MSDTIFECKKNLKPNKQEAIRHKFTTENVAEIDYVTKCIGSIGTWQAIVCFTISLSRFLCMWNMLSIIFLTPATKFVCVKFETNGTVNIQNEACYEDCIEYEYYNEVFEKTLIAQYDLICEKAWLANFTQTVLLFGVIVGTSTFGWISDRHGRRNALRIATLFNIIFMLAAPYSPSYWSFNVIRFFVGVTSGGIIVISSVVAVEVVGSNQKEAAVCYVHVPDGIAEATLAIFAYYSSTWDIFLFEYWNVSVLIFFAILYLPETPRWLVSNGKLDQAIELLTKAAKMNNLNTDHITDTVTKTIETIKNEQIVEKKWTYIDFFGNNNLRKKFVCSLILYTSAGIGFFGINQYMTIFGSNIYISVIALGLIQVPMGFVAMIFNKLFGRKIVTAASCFVTGLSMFFLTFIPKGHWTAILFGVMGMSAVSTLFSVIYVFVSELFPTPLRNMAFGFGSAGAKLGAMITPFIVTLTPHWVPSIVLAVISILAGFVSTFLPETKGDDLLDTVNT